MDVKLACSQLDAASKEVVSEALTIGNARWATLAMEAPAPRSRMARAATTGRKAVPREDRRRDPSSSLVAGWWAFDSK